MRFTYNQYPLIDYHYWVWRSTETKEPVCLVRTTIPVPFSACAEQVETALAFPLTPTPTSADDCYFDKPSIYSDDGFTVGEWNTWFAFEICTAITIYVKETRTRHDIIVWGWDVIKP